MSISLLQDTARQDFEAGAHHIGFTPEEYREFATPEKEQVLHFKIGHTSALGVVVIDSTLLGDPRGGKSYYVFPSRKFRPEDIRDFTSPVRGKANMMTIKNASLRLGGAKAAEYIEESLFSITDPDEASAWRRQAAWGFVEAGLAAGILFPDADHSHYSWAPDERTGPADMHYGVEAMERQTGVWVPAIATGKPVGNDPEGRPYGGIEGRDEITGRGSIINLRNLIPESPALKSKDVITVGVHGFGNVGSHGVESLLDFQAQGNDILSRCVITAAADVTGGAYAESGLRFNSFEPLREKERHNPNTKISLKDTLDTSNKPDAITSQQLLTQNVDVLFLAAKADVIYHEEDLVLNPDLGKDGVLWSDVKARVIVEGGNGCVTHAAQQAFIEKGGEFYCGAETNRSGALVSGLEREFGRELMENDQAQAPELAVVRQIVDEDMTRNFQQISRYAEKHNVSRPLATMALALLALREVMQKRQSGLIVVGGDDRS